MKCNHFSIRGYVAEFRKRDPKPCNPFSLYDSQDDSTKPGPELPPMVVPKFRWWRCDGCVPGAGVGFITGIGKGDQKSADVADAQLLSIGQRTKVDIPKRRNYEASTSTDSIHSRNYTSPSDIFADPKGKGKSPIEDELVEHRGYENGFLKDSSIRGILQQSAGPVEANCSSDDEVSLRSRCNENGIIKSHRKKCRSNRIEIRTPEEVLNHEHVNVYSEVAGIIDEPSGEGKAAGRLVPLPDLNEFNGEPSEDDNQVDVLVTASNNVFDDDDDYLGADHRKTPKVRLLSELLGLKENQNDATMVKNKIPLFTCKSKVSEPEGMSPVNENVKRKSVGSQDEESKSIEIRGSSNGTKKLRTPEIMVSESDSEDESTEIISETLARKRCKSNLDKNPFLEKNNKKSKIDQGGSSLITQPKIRPKSSHDTSKSSEKHVCADFTMLKPSRSSQVDGVIDLPGKTDTFNQLNHRNLVLAKKKSKIPQVGKEQTFVTPGKNDIPRESTANGKYQGVLQSSVENVQSKSNQDGYAEMGFHYFPNSYVTAGNGRLQVAPVKDGFYMPSFQPQPVSVDRGFVRKHIETRNVEENSMAFRTAIVGPSTGCQFDGDRERRVGILNLKGKQWWIPESEEGIPTAQYTVMQNQKELTSEVRRRMQDIDINSIPTEDKVPEQSSGDDIPMDIVELMAKNQYERHLSDPKDNHYYSTTPVVYGKNIRSNGNNGAYGEPMPKLGQSHFLNMQKPVHTDARNHVINGFNDIGSSRQKMLGPLSSFNRTHLGQVPARFNPAGQGQEHVSPYSALSFTSNDWNSNMAAQRCHPSFLHTMESYNRFRAASPRPLTEPHAWPSVIASRMPMGITTPRTILQSSNALDKRKIHHPGPTIFNFDACNSGNQNVSFSNACNGENPESSTARKYKRANYPPKPIGSVDLYSNEAIPAMHLLSLMQNAAKMQPGFPPLAMDGKPEPTKRPLIFPDQQYNQRSSSHDLGSRKTVGSCSSQPCYPAALPTAHPLGPSHQTERGVGRHSGLIGPIPLTSRGQRTMESSHFAAMGGDHRPQKSTPCDVTRKLQQLAPALNKGKALATMSSHSFMNPLQGAKGSRNYLYGLGRRCDERTICPMPGKQICMVNRNPSELNDLKELRRYMIGPEDLRPRGKDRDKSARPRGSYVKKQEIRMNKQRKP